jgi:mRNA interferase MazF
MARGRYVPRRGDLVWIDLDPRHGHEQAGHRPALVLSPSAYNRKTGLCLVCPATRQLKGYAFEVIHRGPEGEWSAILSDHIRSVDWRARRARFFERVSPEVLGEVVARIEALVVSPDED